MPSIWDSVIMKGQINQPDRYCLSYCPFRQRLRFCAFFKDPLLHFIFGKVDADVMEASSVFSCQQLPILLLHCMTLAHLFFRAQENTKGPLIISVISNVMNIVGNAILIWGFHMGVAGAAIATLVSRIFCAVVVLWQLRKDRQPIVVRDYLKIPFRIVN